MTRPAAEDFRVNLVNIVETGALGAINGEAVAALITRAERLARSQRHPRLRHKDLGHLQRVGWHTTERTLAPAKAATKGRFAHERIEHD
jgi:hypothetical protein